MIYLTYTDIVRKLYFSEMDKTKPNSEMTGAMVARLAPDQKAECSKSREGQIFNLPV